MTAVPRRRARVRGQLPTKAPSPVQGLVHEPPPAPWLFVAEVYGWPAPQGSKKPARNRSGMAEDNVRTLPWRDTIKRVCARPRGWEELDGALEAEFDFVFDPPASWDRVSPPSTKSTYDTDKLVRAAFDAMKGVWVDDARCTREMGTRWYVGQAGAPLPQAGMLVKIGRWCPPVLR